MVNVYFRMERAEYEDIQLEDGRLLTDIFPDHVDVHMRNGEVVDIGDFSHFLADTSAWRLNDDALVAE